MSAEKAILCQDLQAHYGRHQVLRGVNLEVSRGVVFALLGTNGAGKTTLIRSLLGLIPSGGGKAVVLGEDPWRTGPSVRQKIGYVSEEQGLYSWMRVAQLVDFCRGLYDHWREELVTEYLERFELSPKTRVASMSKGQKVRLALILALAPEPELLILDEPMSGLDPLAQHEFLRIIQQVAARDGRTIFFSTHNLPDVEAIATHVAILNGGVIKIAGEIGQVRQSVLRLRLPSQAGAQLPPGAYLLETDAKMSTYLFAGGAQNLRESAAAGLSGAKPEEATLEEVFLFFCAGRENDAERHLAAN